MAEHRRVYLHIGAPKTGTTYLQRVLAANRDRLAEDGVLYPVVGAEAHHQAAWGLRPENADGTDSSQFRGQWDALVAEATDWSGHTVVISSEMFVFFGPRRAAEVLSSFGDAQMHVVYSARDLMRQVPAVWQEQVKNRKTQKYRTFVLDLLGPRTTTMARHFWQAQDAPEALKRWSQGLPASRVHVVTAPVAGSPPTLLWERFAEAIGIDGRGYQTSIPAANTSLGAAAAEVLRRYNARFAAELPIRQYRREVVRPLLPALVGGVTEDAKLPLGRVEQRLLHRRCRSLVAGLEQAGYDVAGSLEDLAPPPTGGARARAKGGPDDLSDQKVIDALLDVVHDLLGTQRALAREVAQVKRGAGAVGGPHPSVDD